MAIEIFRPMAAGDVTEWVPVGDTINWQMVDEEAQDGDTTYVKKITVPYQNQTDLYSITHVFDDGGAPINFVKLYAWLKRAATYADLMYIGLKSGATEHWGSVIDLGAIGAWTEYTRQFDTNPNTGSPWTWGAIQALQIGVATKEEADAGGQCTQIYVEVDYTPYTVHEKTLTDGIALTDTLVKTPIKFVSDGVALTDVLVKNPIKFLTDGIAFTDVLEKYRILIKVLTDSIAFTDTLVKSIDKRVSDGIQFTDTLIKTPIKVLTDGIKLGEVLRKDIAKTFTDRIAFKDVVTKAISKVLVDGIAFRDVISYVKNPTVLAKLIRKLIQLEDTGGD